MASTAPWDYELRHRGAEQQVKLADRWSGLFCKRVGLRERSERERETELERKRAGLERKRAGLERKRAGLERKKQS